MHPSELTFDISNSVVKSPPLLCDSVPSFSVLYERASTSAESPRSLPHVWSKPLSRVVLLFSNLTTTDPRPTSLKVVSSTSRLFCLVWVTSTVSRKVSGLRRV